MSTRIPRVLSIAGTDPTGGAGIQADIKSIAANGGYGMAVVTALVAQNTRGVRSVHVPPVAFLAQQLDAVSDDVQIDAVKIGMLGTAEVIETVAGWLERAAPAIIVLDPVMVATSGDRLLDRDAEAALRALTARVHLVTPNIPELAILAQETVATEWEGVLAQAARVSERHGVMVLAKGGHLSGATAPDALVDAGRGAVSIVEFPGVRIETTNTHGTGCSLSSAITTRAAMSGDWAASVREAKRWLAESIQHGSALAVGMGNGPISHFAGLWERGGTATRALPDDVATEWWEHVRDVRDGIAALPFVRGLSEGTLDRQAFIWYLQQDALYLREYAWLLSEASRLSPSAYERDFWAAGAERTLRAELQLHERWIPTDEQGAVSTTTVAYLAHLKAAAASGYDVLVAALLPCYWLYDDLGRALAQLSHPEHPYGEWLDTYTDEEFAAAAAEALSVATSAAARAHDSTRAAMRDAFRTSALHEHAFFAAPLQDKSTSAGAG